MTWTLSLHTLYKLIDPCEDVVPSAQNFDKTHQDTQLAPAAPAGPGLTSHCASMACTFKHKCTSTASRELCVEIFPCADGAFLLPKRCAEAAEAPASPSTESLKELLYWEDRYVTAAPMPGNGGYAEAQWDSVL